MSNSDAAPIEKNGTEIFPVIRTAGITDTGKIREHNEDNFFIDNELQLYIVADGMGGHQAGEKASEMIVNILPGKIRSLLEEEENPNLVDQALRINSTIRRLSLDVYQESNTDPDLKGMGSTLAFVLIRKSKALVGHMGDSRVYLMRGNCIEQLTMDHSVVMLMLKLGKITLEESFNHPLRHIITRSVGMEGDTGPEIRIIDLEEGDILLLCSDGLTDMLADKTIGRVLMETDDIEESARKLVEEANKSGGRDNITVVLLQYGRLAGQENPACSQLRIRRPLPIPSKKEPGQSHVRAPE